MKIRFATLNDFASVIDIYNQAILALNATADVDILSVDDRIDWFYRFYA